MCRLLAIRNLADFAIRDHLVPFAALARASREYQGHGWGCSYRTAGGNWQHHHDVRPIWEDDLTRFGSTCHLLAHARSAFRDEGITVDNNMPFHDDQRVFIFNGELHGVRIRSAGRIGAEKIFNYIKRFDDGDLAAALTKGTTIIHQRSRRVRAMNIVISDGNRFFVSSSFDEMPDYFTMHARVTDAQVVICSDPYELDGPWQTLPTDHVQVL